MTVTLKENGCKNRGNSWPHLATAVLYHLRSRPLTTTLRPFQIFGCKAAAARRWPCELHKHNGWKKERVLELMAVSTLDDVCFPLKLYVGSGVAVCCWGLPRHLFWTFLPFPLRVECPSPLCLWSVPWICFWTSLCHLSAPVPSNPYSAASSYLPICAPC